MIWQKTTHSPIELVNALAELQGLMGEWKISDICEHIGEHEITFSIKKKE